MGGVVTVMLHVPLVRVIPVPRIVGPVWDVGDVLHFMVCFILIIVTEGRVVFILEKMSGIRIFLVRRVTRVVGADRFPGVKSVISTITPTAVKFPTIVVTCCLPACYNY